MSWNVVEARGLASDSEICLDPRGPLCRGVVWGRFALCLHPILGLSRECWRHHCSRIELRVPPCAPTLRPDRGLAESSPRIAPVRDGAMSNRDNANSLPGLGELVDDAVRADAKRAEPRQPPAQHVPGDRVSLEQPEGVLYSVDQRPVEFE